MIYGIDVSHHQQAEEIDWEALKKRESIDFCYIRATYGTRVDREAEDHAEACDKVGIAYGFYHFYRHHQDAEAQLEAFCDAVPNADLYPALDLEYNSYDPEVASTSAYHAGAIAIASGLVSAFGDVVFYCSPAWIHAQALASVIGSRPLWLAHWDVEPMQSKQRFAYEVHQYGKRKLEGSPYAVDVNAATEGGFERIRVAGMASPPEDLEKKIYAFKPGTALYFWPDGSFRRTKPEGM